MRRTANRRDFSLTPFAPTLLDLLKEAGHPVVAIGKIEDLFAGRGVTDGSTPRATTKGWTRSSGRWIATASGLIFANLVDFDSQYGHRNDVTGYAANLERFDARLAALLPRLRQRDLLMVTADHGNDPTTPSTDHSREYVPVMIAGAVVRRNTDLGIRTDVRGSGQTIAESVNVGPLPNGTSFPGDILQRC